MDKENEKTWYKNRRGFHEGDAELNAQLDVFGNQLAKQHGWSELEDDQAVRFYLLRKHHWLPSQVNSMTYAEMRFALSEELAGWLPPENVRSAAD